MSPEQIQALVASGQLSPDVAQRLAMPQTVAPSGPPQPMAMPPTVAPSQQPAPLPMPPTVAPSGRRPPGFSGWVREGLQENALGLAGMDPVRELERIDERKAMAEAARDAALKDARRLAGGFEVIMEQGGDTPGQMIVDKDGRHYWVPAYGPNAAEPIEIQQGVDPAEVMQFARGPEPSRDMMLAALAGRSSGGQ